MKPFIYAYSMASDGAKRLAKAMNTRLIKHKNSKFKWGSRSVINWGAAHPPGPAINEHSYNATNKLIAFNRFREAGVPHPEFTTSLDEAMDWVAAGKRVFARTTITGKEGEGIVNLNENPGTKARLYTQYKRKDKEFRVHVVHGRAIDVQEKRRRHGHPPALVRNWDNGYVFCRNGVEEPLVVRTAAIQAVAALSLDFGAVDVIYNSKFDKVYVLEVNTAPGLSNTTAKLYAEALNG